jgi:hypothetical protein
MGSLTLKDHTFTDNKDRVMSKEDLETPGYKELTKEYLLSHKDDIIRRIDVLVLYISSFRKIFEKNIGLINGNIIPHIITSQSAVDGVVSYLDEYLVAITRGFMNASNGFISICQNNIILEEIDTEEYDFNSSEEYTQISNALLKTASDVSAIGRAFGESYFASAWEDHKSYKIKISEYSNAGNIKDRYLVNINFNDKRGYAELNIINFFKLGK